jgi:hypothetical protein
VIVYRDGRMLAAINWCCNVAMVRVDYTKVEQHDINSLSIEITLSNRPIVTYKQMHERMFHAGPDRMILACKKAGIKIFVIKAYNYMCKFCNFAKARILTSYMLFVFSQRFLTFVYFDIISNKLGYEFKRYIVHAVNAYFRFHWIGYTNDKASQIMNELCISMVKRLKFKINKKLQAAQFDNGTEFPDFVRFLKNKGVIIRSSTANHYEMVGLIKKIGGEIIEKARCAIIATGLPDNMWPFAQKAAIRIHNLLPSSANPQHINPYKRLVQWLNLHKKYYDPYIAHLRTWGCKAWVWKKIDKLDRTKPRAFEERLVNYGNLEGTIYYIYIPATKKVLRCSNVKFEDAEVFKYNSYEKLNGVAEFEDLSPEDLGVAIEDPIAETVNPNPLLTPSAKGTHDVLESHPREETTIVEAQGFTPSPDVVRIVLDDLIEKERKALDSKGFMPLPEPFLSEDNEFYDALSLGSSVLQTGKKSLKKQNENSNSDNGEVLYQPANQNIADAATLSAPNMPDVFPHKNLDRTMVEDPEPNPDQTIIEDPEPNPDRTIIENPEPNLDRTIIEDPEPNPERTIIEDPEPDPDSNSSSEPATMAENHLQKDGGRLRGGPRKKYNVQKLTKQAFGKALVYLEKDQFIPDNRNIYFALLSIKAAISF